MLLKNIYSLANYCELKIIRVFLGSHVALACSCVLGAKMHHALSFFFITESLKQIKLAILFFFITSKQYMYLSRLST